MSGGGGSNTTTTQSGPPQQFLDAYTNVNNKAQQVAAAPYQNYPGQVVAGLSPDQLAGIQQTEATANIGMPYLNTAAQYISQSQQPVMNGQIQGLVNNATSGGIQTAANQGVGGIQTAAGNYNPGNLAQWEDPYTQQVVKATQAEFQNQNQQQATQLAGNAASQGAYGGDREQVAQAILAGQQQLAQAPQIASLENQGYQTALGALGQQSTLGLQGAQAAGQLGLTGAAQNAAVGLQGAGTLLGANEAQGWLASQGGYGMANLGNEATTLGLEGANSLLGVGGLEQQQAQESLNVPYEQWVAQQAYPFQTTGWLANIAEGLGSAAGGTSSTTYPSPSTGSQIAGAGLAGVGALGQSGAFGSNGWLSNAFSSGGGGSGISPVTSPDLTAPEFTGDFNGMLTAARGGGIPHRAPGGGIPVPTGVPNLDVSIVPTGSMGHGMSPLWNSQNSTTTQTKSGGQAGNIIGDIADVVGLVAAPFTGGASLAAAGAVNALAHSARGGTIPHVPQTMGMRERRASGGPLTVSMAPASYSGGTPIPQISTTPTAGMGNVGSQGGGIQAVNDYLAQQKAGAWTPPANPAPAPAPTPPAPPVDPNAALELASEQQAADAQAWSGGHNKDGGIIKWRGPIKRRDDGGAMDDDDPLGSTAPQPTAPVTTQPTTMGIPQRQRQQHGDPWRAMMDVGLGIMGGNSPNALTNVGQGALKGLHLYEEDEDRRSTIDARRQAADSLQAYRQQQGQLAQQKEGREASKTKFDEDVAAQKLSGYLGNIKSEIGNREANTGLHAQSVGLEGQRVGIARDEEGVREKELADKEHALKPLTYPLDNGNIGMIDSQGNITDTGRKFTARPVAPNPNAETPEQRQDSLDAANARSIMSANPNLDFATALKQAKQARQPTPAVVPPANRPSLPSIFGGS